MASTAGIPRTALAAWVHAARERTLALVADLSDQELRVPRLETVNPFLWELGHVAWFQERWALREAAGEAPAHARGDDWWDSSEVAHDTRWELEVLSRDDTVRYAEQVAGRVLALLEAAEPDERTRYLVLLTVFHEDMHAEAFTYMRQALGRRPPPEVMAALARERPPSEPLGGGDVEIARSTLRLGSERDAAFVFDNEKWAHDVEVGPFAIARRPVTQAEFRVFVEEEGYAREELWSDEGRRWCIAEEASLPTYWRRGSGGFERRRFDTWIPLEPDLPVSHVSWFEAEAFARFAGRRLPTEAEWEAAAALDGPAKRRFPWGDELAPERANLDARFGDVVDTGAFTAGDSPSGIRQALGNVWEWTATEFQPFAGFAPDAYRDYSAPWFGTRKVLRGGSWMTASRLVHAGWRNFFQPWRRDVATGFRTCAT